MDDLNVHVYTKVRIHHHMLSGLLTMCNLAMLIEFKTCSQTIHVTVLHIVVIHIILQLAACSAKYEAATC